MIEEFAFIGLKVDPIGLLENAGLTESFVGEGVIPFSLLDAAVFPLDLFEIVVLRAEVDFPRLDDDLSEFRLLFDFPIRGTTLADGGKTGSAFIAAVATIAFPFRWDDAAGVAIIGATLPVLFRRAR